MYQRLSASDAAQVIGGDRPISYSASTPYSKAHYKCFPTPQHHKIYYTNTLKVGDQCIDRKTGETQKNPKINWGIGL